MTTPGEGSSTYDEGTVVNLVATRDIGYRFVKWSGDVETVEDINAASTTITVNRDYSIAANFEQEAAVYFPDPNLEATVREAIDIPERPIYPSDLEGLASLDAGQRNITDLTGLEHCTGLTSLDLGWNHVSDISPLANLTNLTTLYLNGNQISDIYPLVQNTGLDTGDSVDLQVNPLSDDSINVYIPELQARGVTVDY